MIITTARQLSIFMCQADFALSPLKKAWSRTFCVTKPDLIQRRIETGL